MIVVTPRKNDNYKRRMHSEKVHESAARTTIFSNPMVLSFEHTRAAGARSSKKRKSNSWVLLINAHLN